MKTLLTLLAIVFFYLSALAQNPLTDSLIAYYPFNGNANDVTGNGNNGIVYGTTLTIDRFGNPNAAYSFVASDSIIYTAGPNYQPGFPMSVTAWIKANSTESGVIFGNDFTNDHCSGIGLVLIPSSGGILAGSFGDGGVANTSTTRRSKIGTINVNDNQWHFIAYVLRGPTDMDLYVDCNYDTLAQYSGSGGSLAYVRKVGGTGKGYTGIVDDLRFYHNSLTQNDLQHIYSYPKPYDNLSVSLGNDTTICTVASNTPLTLTPSVTGNVQSYTWSNNSTDSSITVSQSGTYSVTVFDGCGFASDSMKVTYSSCSNGINDVADEKSINMIYNTGTQTVQIQNLDESNIAEMFIDVYDCIGQKVNPDIEATASYKSTYNYHLPSNLSAGIYIVRVRCGNESKALPVYVQEQ